MDSADARAQLTPASYFGQSNWWGFPQQGPGAWFGKWENGQYWVSPNKDFSTPLYAAKINTDGYFVIQDLYQSTLNRLTSGTN